ncbi:MAG: hypothetical protein WAV50_03015 [Minisyncoccia bacterium]
MKALYVGGLWLLASIFTVVANLVTVPFGLGLVRISHKPDFVRLVVPFQHHLAGTPQSWVWTLVPLWIFIATVLVLQSIVLPI